MSLSIEVLRQQGFPRGVVDALKQAGVETLLDHQVEAVQRFDLLGSEDLLVSLPTSCGKTLIGELAGVGAALMGRRALFSVPLKALAREKYEAFEKRYGSYGLRICLATGEFDEHQHRLQSGDFDIAVLIHEKLLHGAIRDPGFLSKVSVAVLDELQGVEEPSRGPSLEFLLALLKNSQPRVRRVGLAGTLAPGDPLIADFEGRVLTAHKRPVDLHEGIILTDPDLARLAASEYGLEIDPEDLDETSFLSMYRSHNSGLVEAEFLPRREFSSDSPFPLLELAAGLAERGETCLVFLPSRREAERAAMFLAESREPLEAAAAHLNEEGLEEENLRYCLERGVGFHHADCSPAHRQQVEQAFREGWVKVLCCTSTLAAGVNLPAQNVLIHPFVWNRQGGNGELALLSESVVRNMAGRAGRLGLEESHGRALLLANNQREWDLYRNRYWTSLVPSLKPCLFEEDWGPRLLAGVAIGHRTRSCLETLFRETLSGREAIGLDERLTLFLEDALNLELLEHEDTASMGREVFKLSPLGRVVALRGISFATAHLFAGWVERIEGREPSLLAALLRVCSTPEALAWNWPRDSQPEVRAMWVERVRERLSWDFLESFGDHWQGRSAVSREFEDAAKMALGLAAWCEGQPIQEIHSSFPGLGAGTLHTAGEGARWLIEALADVWLVQSGAEKTAEELRRWGQSAGSGLPEEALAWTVVPSDLLDRETKLRLAREHPNPVSLLRLTEEDLRSLPHPILAHRVREFLLRSLTQRPKTEKEISPEERRAPEGILLDANFREWGNLYRFRTFRDSPTIGVRGAELLLRLVRARKNGNPEGWLPREGLNIAPENISQRVSELRRRLGHPPAGCKSWIESDRSGHYRIACEPHQILWDATKTPDEIAALIH